MGDAADNYTVFWCSSDSSNCLVGDNGILLYLVCDWKFFVSLSVSKLIRDWSCKEQHTFFVQSWLVFPRHFAPVHFLSAMPFLPLIHLSHSVSPFSLPLCLLPCKCTNIGTPAVKERERERIIIIPRKTL